MAEKQKHYLWQTISWKTLCVLVTDILNIDHKSLNNSWECEDLQPCLVFAANARRVVSSDMFCSSLNVVIRYSHRTLLSRLLYCLKTLNSSIPLIVLTTGLFSSCCCLFLKKIKLISRWASDCLGFKISWKEKSILFLMRLSWQGSK